MEAELYIMNIIGTSPRKTSGDKGLGRFGGGGRGVENHEQTPDRGKSLSLATSGILESGI